MITDLTHDRLAWRRRELQAVAKSTTTNPDHWWTIRCVKGNEAAVVGIVKAPDTETAIKVAIEEFGLVGDGRNRLIAQRRG